MFKNCLKHVLMNQTQLYAQQFVDMRTKLALNTQNENKKKLLIGQLYMMTYYREGEEKKSLVFAKNDLCIVHRFYQ